MAVIDHNDALDDWHRGTFDSRVGHCVCDFRTARNPQYLQPRLQEQGTDNNDDNDDDIDRDEIFCGAHCRPRQAQIRQEEQEPAEQEGRDQAQGGGRQQRDATEYDDQFQTVSDKDRRS